jgi:L-threonylcarbamoyladenylate synthase
MDAGSNPQNMVLIEPYGKAAIADAAGDILAGKCVAVPTETVYGLAADSTHAAGVAAIYTAKGRPDFNPLIVHVTGVAMARALTHWSDTADQLAAAFWPGPLTMVLPLAPDTPIAPAVTAGLDTLAIRCPAHPAMQDLIRAVGRPLAAPSANRSGAISPTTAQHVADSLGGRIARIIDGGPCAVGLESTILQVTDEALTLLRPGSITAEQIGAATGLPVQHAAADREIAAPGMLASHYAPKKPLMLNVEIPAPEQFHIGFGAISGDINLSAEGDLAMAAAQLFAALHTADASGKPSIAVAPVPDTGIGLAIRDRLNRAAHD